VKQVDRYAILVVVVFLEGLAVASVMPR